MNQPNPGFKKRFSDWFSIPRWCALFGTFLAATLALLPGIVSLFQEGQFAPYDPTVAVLAATLAGVLWYTTFTYEIVAEDRRRKRGESDRRISRVAGRIRSLKASVSSMHTTLDSFIEAHELSTDPNPRLVTSLHTETDWLRTQILRVLDEIAELPPEVQGPVDVAAYYIHYSRMYLAIALQQLDISARQHSQLQSMLDEIEELDLSELSEENQAEVEELREQIFTTKHSLFDPNIDVLKEAAEHLGNAKESLADATKALRENEVIDFGREREFALDLAERMGVEEVQKYISDDLSPKLDDVSISGDPSNSPDRND